jgi:DNA-binding winged helix-turn-helix (wHTH) protein
MAIRFGEFEFDGDAHRLWRHGKQVRLDGKTFGLLGILLSRRPAVVSRNELRERLWPHTFVTDAELTAVVSRLRQALGEDSQGGAIHSVQGFGYAFGGEALDESGVPTTAELGPTVVREGVTFSLGQGENVLGRGEEGAVFVDDASVSRRHARIMVSGETATLEDLGSRNGTWLGAKRLNEPAVLEDGSSFRLGSALLEFRKAAASRSARAVVDSVPDEA